MTMKWVSVKSHRARQKLTSLLGYKPIDHGRWTKDNYLIGEYYEIPADVDVSRIKGVTVLAKAPAALFKRLRSEQAA